MDIIEFKEDIPTFYVEAEGFPSGVKEAHDKLHSLLSGDEDRPYYGISHNTEDRGIVYCAAAREMFPGEAQSLGCKGFLVAKGSYLAETLHHWRKEEGIIALTFQKLLHHPSIDPNGYCLEIYHPTGYVQCMVKLDDELLKIKSRI